MVKLTESLVLARSRASDLENVRKLNVWGSELSDISILRKMSNVQVVSLSVNKITTLADFVSCKNLEELYIRKNCIPNIEEIVHLKKLPKLRILWLADNPCADIPNYRMTVLKALPNLQKFDNLAVEENEINDAIEQGSDIPDTVSAPKTTSQSAVFTHENKPADETSASASVLPNNKKSSATPDGAAGGDTATGGATDVKSEGEVSDEEKGTPQQISWEETNKIRQQLGLKPLPVEKITSLKPRAPAHSAKARNSNILQAVLSLIKELDGESLQIASDAIRNKLESL